MNALHEDNEDAEDLSFKPAKHNFEETRENRLCHESDDDDEEIDVVDDRSDISDKGKY